MWLLLSLENLLEDSISNPVCFSQNANIPGKGMNPMILFQAIGK